MAKTLIITGASHGIGAATAHLAAQRGFAVCLNYHEVPARAESVARDINSAGGSAIAAKADVTRQEDVKSLFDQAEKALGPVFGLVNNASRYGTRGNLDALDPGDIERTIAVTLTATILCAREAMMRMAQSRGGSGGAIVNLSSNAVGTGGFGLAPYVAAKGGIEALTRALAREAGSEGIRINAVSPGAIDTEATAAAGPDWRARQEKATPLGRLGTPEEVASTILWLLSDEASYVNGAVLPINGGRF
jgi:NAD(P)-dependent dehydrogenase (short-subunit alcohol dehydrogenase family)